MKLVERLRLGGPNAAEVTNEAADEIERLLRHHPNPADYRYWEGRYRDAAAEIASLRIAAHRAADIIDKHLNTQREKVTDASAILRDALAK